ncbi:MULTISPECIES: SusD/RagB family nutrient-binding outer membrane lipoprotein [Bacteroides]|jgi:hypothetical protein|uniref:SusD/RagB family nutrient-binding outer membrane lipoprotein n=1 Tax=Bacteroides TaxID=816 RepID=UPI000E47DD7B|nr:MULTISPECIES: SusD/RagB family nutrient-binding outer membrane lipoprotein [Bacteroides]RHL12753.1 SusD/RagB family nutrient-binding outer membrane lipoprotein [Bacteroides sp. AF39-11AC]
MKKLSIIAILATVLSFNTSCDDYLDVNNNVDAPDYIEGYLYLSGIIQNYQSIYYDIRAVGPLTQMMGTSSYTNFANNYYTSGSDAGGELWRMVYWLQGMNLENLINQSVANEEWRLAGIGLAIKAFSWDKLTKYHGELPMKEAFTPDQLSHHYDSQEDIYAQVREWAYKAIEYLEREDIHSYGSKISSNDWIYKGDKDKWIKFAYSVIVRNLASLSNKSDFVNKYALELIECAGKAFQSPADDATVSVEGKGESSAESTYNNFWGTYRGNLSRSYFQHEYAVQVMTGSIPKYDETTGEKYRVENQDYYPYELAEGQIVCDTLKDVAGHYDPRMAVKLATTDNADYEDINDADSVKSYHYYGSTFTSTSGPIGTTPSFYGRNATSQYQGDVNDGKGKWIYRDDAPYILMTYAEIKFCAAETYYKMGEKTFALQAFKEGVKADLEFTATYIYPGTPGQTSGGDKITKELFSALASEYANGPYVEGMTADELTLSHIMMQKWVALYPWGAHEAWVDMRKYHYDIQYSGEYPKLGNGWSETMVDQKWDTDDSKVYKGFYLAPAQVQGRKGQYNTRNYGSPCFRVRPRYNSEYMWNVPSLESLTPISGTADNYQCSIPWFAFPGEMPENL